jgi:hypothetical protein
VSTPLRVLPPAAALFGRMTRAAAAMASAPVQRGSLRNAQAALAMHHPVSDRLIPSPNRPAGLSLARPGSGTPSQD